MKKYEILFIIDKDVVEEKREEAIAKVEAYITENNGAIIEVEKWGMKKFAYPINYKNEGFYVLIKFELDPSLLLELKRRMGLNEAYVREMITNVIENKKTLAVRKPRAPRPTRESAPAAAPVVAQVAPEVAPATEEAPAQEAPATEEVAPAQE
ncbi:MAG: 30S ribosomal protein S6 [Bacillota bacterium]